MLLVTALMIALLFLPLAVLNAGDRFFSFDVWGVRTMTAEPESIYPVWGLFALAIVIALLALVTVFLFRKRMLQIRLCVFNAFLLIGFYLMFGFFCWNLKGLMEPFSLQVKLALAFPAVCLILDYLAIRNIGADEALVRSLNRLR